MVKLDTTANTDAHEGQISVWIIEDHMEFRRTVLDMLTLEPDFRVTAFGNCEDALARLEAGHAAHVILLDIGLPGISGLEGITRFKSLSPATQIIILSAFDDSQKIRKAIMAGATGYLLKTGDPAQISGNIRDVLHGGAPLDTHIARQVLTMLSGGPNQSKYNLAPRELEVLKGIVAGKTAKEIAHDMSVSYYTIDTYMRRIYQKMDVQSRGLAVSKALQERLV